MKKKKYQKIIIAIIVMNLVTLFSFIPSSSVVGFFEQSLQVPLQLELTPSQYWLNEQTRNNLIATYGISLFNSCSASERWCTNSMNASEYGNCLRFVQLDLAQGTMPGCQTPCLSGYIRVSSGECLTPEMGCNKEFGQDSHFIKYNSSGVPQCGSWDSKCKNDYGANSVWVGRLSNDGKAICDCAQGYVANPNGTNSCVVQTPSGTLCNGKYWNACPADQKFYCPSTGDAQCIENEELVVPVSTTNNPSPVTVPSQPQKPIIEKKQTQSDRITISTLSATGDQKPVIKDEQVTTTDKDKELTKTPLDHKGFFPKLWSWFKNLFGF